MVLINGRKAHSGDYINSSDLISILEDDSIKHKPIFEKIIKVLFEDDHLAVVEKPAGLLTSGNQKATLANCLPFNLKKSELDNALIRPYPVHRLDYATSGLMIIAKTNQSIISLSDKFKNKEIKKTYLAVTIGKMPQRGLIESDIDNKTAQSEYLVKKCIQSAKFDFINLVEVKPYTGRRHQIRKHLLSIGFPICGDLIYNQKEKNIKGNGLYLLAQKLQFVHPISNQKMNFETEIPKKFNRLFGIC
ncbi:MAG: RluA family pseudouridine synthase [Saprospiraceae bacterium]|nr:RluA family pseudouridine synthase [Saprospiraceae bacterium]